MLTAKAIRGKCQKDIEELQKICSHENSRWMNEEFSPEHSTGRIVKVCDVCEKVLESNPRFNYNIIT